MQAGFRGSRGVLKANARVLSSCPSAEGGRCAQRGGRGKRPRVWPSLLSAAPAGPWTSLSRTDFPTPHRSSCHPCLLYDTPTASLETRPLPEPRRQLVLSLLPLFGGLGVLSAPRPQLWGSWDRLHCGSMGLQGEGARAGPPGPSVQPPPQPAVGALLGCLGGGPCACALGQCGRDSEQGPHRCWWERQGRAPLGVRWASLPGQVWAHAGCR